MEEMTERIAAAGYFGVTPDLYHRDGPDCKDEGPTRRTRLRDTGIIKDVNATVDFLKTSKLVNSGRVGIVGFCLGGRVAYLMAASNPSFKRRGQLLRRRHLQIIGRGPYAFRADGGDQLSDPGPLRRAG